MMRRIALLLFCAASVAFGQAPQSPAGSASEQAVRAIVSHWQQTWDTFDASGLANDYAPDAEFVNAFGTKLKGSAEILRFMSQVVKRPNVKNRHTTWEEPRVRFIRPDVAIVSRDYRTVGFADISGRDMGERKTHAQWVLAKDNDSWRIVSQFISDENGAGTPPPR